MNWPPIFNGKVHQHQAKNKDSEPEVGAVEDRMPIFNNIFDTFKSPFVKDIQTFHFKEAFLWVTPPADKKADLFFV